VSKICPKIGRWTLFAFKKPSLMLCRVVLCAVYGVVVMWTGVVWIPAGFQMGILIIWDKRVVEKVVSCVGVYSLSISFRNVVDRSTWAFAGVYGPNSDRDRSLLWDELAGLLSWWNLYWCIGGDFSVTCFPSERSGVARLCSAIMEFSNFISDQSLMDLHLVGGAYTWLIPRDPPIWSRIDRFLISPE